MSNINFQFTLILIHNYFNILQYILLDIMYNEYLLVFEVTKDRNRGKGQRGLVVRRKMTAEERLRLAEKLGKDVNDLDDNYNNSEDYKNNGKFSKVVCMTNVLLPHHKLPRQ